MRRHCGFTRNKGGSSSASTGYRAYVRYESDEIDPTRMANEESEEDEEWEEVGSDGEPVQKEAEEPVDYTILSKSLI